MITNSSNILNPDLVNTASDLKKFLTYRYFENEQAVKNISDAIGDLNTVKNVQDSPETAKEYAKWIGRKIYILNDPLFECISESLKIKSQISAKGHLYGMLSMAVEGESSLNGLPFEIKKIIFLFLDRVILIDMEKFETQIDAVVKKLRKVF